MRRLFAEGQSLAQAGTVWRTTPPGLEPGEHLSVRGGSTLTIDPNAPTLIPQGNLLDFRRKLPALQQPVAR